MFDVIPGNEKKKKKSECALWRAHRRIWDRLLSPSLAIECQGLRKTYSSIYTEKAIHLHEWQNQAGLRSHHTNIQCQKTVAKSGWVWCRSITPGQVVIQVKKAADIF